MTLNGMPLSAAVAHCTTKRDAEMLSYSGPIHAAEVNRFISFVLQHTRRKNISLILTTYGGDADAAYRLARFLQSFYQHVRLYIVGPCKSAGTLVTLCADELVFGPFGELGPLDMQIAKKDDLMSMVSGLDTFQALSIIRNYAFGAFEESMYNIVENSGGAISTQTAGEFSAALVTGLFQPLMSQLDPQRMGEVQRLINIAKAYGERLNRKNLQPDALRRLVEEYPSHTFIIDSQEATGLFKHVEQISAEEMAVLRALQQAGACLTHPSPTILINDVSALLSEGGLETENEASRRSSPNSREDDEKLLGPSPASPGKGPSVPRPAASRRRQGISDPPATVRPNGGDQGQVAPAGG